LILAENLNRNKFKFCANVVPRNLSFEERM